MPESKHPLKVFVCYAHANRDAVHALYNRLSKDNVDAWFDEEDLVAGSNWEYEIRKAVRESNVVIVCVSKEFNKFNEGYRQKEIELALHEAALKSKEDIFIIPVRLDNSEVPKELNTWQWVNLFEAQGYRKLFQALEVRANKIGLEIKKENKKVSGRKFFQKALSENIVVAIIGALALIVAAVIGIFPDLLFPNSKSVTPTMTFTVPFINTLPASTQTPTQTPSPTPRPTFTPDVYNPNPMETDYIDLIGVPMRLVTAGTFTMGTDTLFPFMSPAHTVKLSAYYIDKFEVTNKLYMACVDAGKCIAPKQINSKTRAEYYGNTSFDNYPVIFVTWEMANKYCQEWRYAELPTEAQWEMAASGADFNSQQAIYPWQTDTINKSYTNYNRNEGDTTTVGKYPLGISPYGTYDMSGNVWEWVRDSINSDSPYYGDPEGVLNPLGAPDNGFKIIRGGGWNNTEDDNLRVDFRGYQLGMSFFRDNLGFRCARVVTP